MPPRGVRSRSSSLTPGAGVKRKCCSRVVKKMNSSILAKLSPRQILRPEGEFKTKTQIPEPRHTGRKRQEGVTLYKFAIFVQKVSRVKAVGFLPLTGVMKDGKVLSPTCRTNSLFADHLPSNRPALKLHSAGFHTFFQTAEQQHPPDLVDEVTLEGDVSAGFVRQRGGNDAGQSLCLMDHGVAPPGPGLVDGKHPDNDHFFTAPSVNLQKVSNQRKWSRARRLLPMFSRTKAGGNEIDQQQDSQSYQPRVIQQSSSSVIVRGGDEVLLACENMMGPINCLQIHWLFSKSDEETAVDLVKSGRTNLTQAAREKADRLTVSSNCSLIIQRVSAADVGTYYCQNKDPKETMHTVALFLVNITEQKDDEEVTLKCSVKPNDPCKHNVKWLHKGQSIDKDNRNLETKDSVCAAEVTFKSSHYVYESGRINSLQCEVAESGGRKQQRFPFRAQTPGNKTRVNSAPAASQSASEDPDEPDATISYASINLPKKNNNQ
ncbi:hypothetical protein CCH79_00000641, partial [Gambusia affinis]